MQYSLYLKKNRNFISQRVDFKIDQIYENLLMLMIHSKYKILISFLKI